MERQAVHKVYHSLQRRRPQLESPDLRQLCKKYYCTVEKLQCESKSESHSKRGADESPERRKAKEFRHLRSILTSGGAVWRALPSPEASAPRGAVRGGQAARASEPNRFRNFQIRKKAEQILRTCVRCFLRGPYGQNRLKRREAAPQNAANARFKIAEPVPSARVDRELRFPFCATDCTVSRIRLCKEEPYQN